MQRRDVLSVMAGAGCLLATSDQIMARTSPLQLSSQDTRFSQRYLDTELGQIYYWTAGSGPDLVLIHQSANSSEEYAELVPHLANHFRLIAMDLPGHGRSDDVGREPTVDDYTNAVESVLDHLGVKKAHMLGHHGGSLVAINLAALQPKRFEKLILSGIGGLRSERENQEFIKSIMSIDRSVRAESDFVAKTWERYISMMSDGANPADVLRPVIAFLQARLRPYLGILANLKWDRRAALAKLKGPVLLVQGGKDEYVHGQASLLKSIPQSSRVVMPGCGTFMFYDKPAECAEMISDYLTKK